MDQDAFAARHRRIQVVATIVLVAGLTLLCALGLTRPETVMTERVGSFWDDVTLSCTTTKLVGDDTDLELFSCRPRSDGTMPIGRFTEATTQWNSDIDRRPAVRHDIRITPAGTVSGWADYRRFGGVRVP